MGVGRYELNEVQWARVAPLVPGKASEPGRTGSDNRLFVKDVCGFCDRARLCAICRSARAGGKTAGAAESATRGDNREVLNYVRALEGAITGLDALPISSRLIRDAHRTLLTGVAWHRGASVEAGGGAQGSGDTQHRWNGSGGELKDHRLGVRAAGAIDLGFRRGTGVTYGGAMNNINELITQGVAEEVGGTYPKPVRFPGCWRRCRLVRCCVPLHS